MSTLEKVLVICTAMFVADWLTNLVLYLVKSQRGSHDDEKLSEVRREG